MLFIICALYQEAKPIVQHYELKKDNTVTNFNVFYNENIRLIISGVGFTAVTCATTFLLTKFNCQKIDFVINIGCAANMSEDNFAPGNLVFVIHKLTDNITKKTFYPDMFHNTTLPEASLISGDKILSSSMIDEFDKSTDKNLLYDMEGAYCYQAAQYFLGPGQIAFIKIISDNGIDSTNDTTIDLSQLMNFNLKKITKFIDILYDLNISTDSINEQISPELFADFKATETMQHSLTQLFAYASAVDFDLRFHIQNMYDEGLLPVQAKKDGAKLIRHLKEILIN